MSVNYTRINWEDTPSTQTPINAENLNAMDSAIDDLAGAVNELDGVTDDVEALENEVGAIKNDLSEFPNGNYPQMGAGYANQLVSGLKKEDQTPYNFRAVPYDATLEEVKKIVGGTVAWNQFATTKSGSVTPNGTNTYSYRSFTSQDKTIAQHKYFICADVTYNGAKLPMRVYTQIGTNNYGSPAQDITVAGTKKCAWIAQFTSGSTSATLGISNVTTSDKLTSEDAWSFDNAMITDLTADFGTTIADYVYSLESATAGAGVAWLKKHFPAQFDSSYQPYDAGTLKSIEGLSGKKTVGFNQWDGVAEVGSLDANGQEEVYPSRSRSKNYIPVLPNTTYYYNKIASIYYYNADKDFISRIAGFQPANTFTTPSDCYYLRFMYNASSVPTDFCINLSDPAKNGTYEPYEAHSYALDSDLVLRGIPKVDASGNLYYDGDEYLPDGTVNRRYGVVDLGTLAWTKSGSGYYSDSISGALPGSSNTGYDHILCPKYVSKNTASISGLSDKTCSIDNNRHIQVKDSAYTTAVDLTASLSGVYLIYELATPTTETALPYQETQIVDDFGTEEFILADGAFPVPVGHETYYKSNLRAKLEVAPDSPDGDGLYVVQQESGKNEYVPLASTSTIQDILTRLTALENENA